jgi:hypothetical protein
MVPSLLDFESHVIAVEIRLIQGYDLQVWFVIAEINH